MTVSSYKRNAQGAWIEADPQSEKDYSIDWRDFLGDDAIQTSTWSTPAEISASAPAAADGVTTVWLMPDGATEGDAYRVVNKIVTTGGRTDRRSFSLVVRQQ